MPTFRVPDAASLHTARSFFAENDPFVETVGPAVLELHPQWAQLDPTALAAIAAWGGWCRRHNLTVEVRNLGRNADYAARRQLFQHLGIEYAPAQVTRGPRRFLPVTQVRDRSEITNVIAQLGTLFAPNEDPDSVTATRYCISELLRNVIEHSNSPEGAYVSAQRYLGKRKRVTIAVADCGRGIAEHLSSAYADTRGNDMLALNLAMRPSVTGARPGVYGTSENAGVGLYFTRSIAKGTGGYFFMASGSAAYRLRRTEDPQEKCNLVADALAEPQHDRWLLPTTWQGTVVAAEIRTNEIADFDGFFGWIKGKLPRRDPSTKRIKFT